MSEAYDRDDITRAFNEEFGANNVKFCEDGSPTVKFEAIQILYR